LGGPLAEEARVALYRAAGIGRATEPRLARKPRVSALTGNDRYRKKVRS